MRPIYLARMEKTRPVVLLTREHLVPVLTSVTVAPITSRIRGIDTEVAVGPLNGIEANSVINCDNITTISRSDLGRPIGFITPEQERQLAAAISHAFDLAPAP
jgi:mRNA interferase MazF